MSPTPRPLGTNLEDPEPRPWFLWDEDLPVRELREVLGDVPGSASASTHSVAARMVEVLNPAQVSGVTHGEGPLLIVGSPGSSPPGS